MFLFAVGAGATAPSQSQPITYTNMNGDQVYVQSLITAGAFNWSTQNFTGTFASEAGTLESIYRSAELKTCGSTSPAWFIGAHPTSNPTRTIVSCTVEPGDYYYAHLRQFLLKEDQLFAARNTSANGWYAYCTCNLNPK